MQFPKSILIAGHRVKIEFSLQVSENYGEWDSDGKRILIHESLRKKPREAFDTIAHEAVHAVLHFTGLHYKMEESDEEALVRMIDNLLFPVFRRLFEAEVRGRKKGRKQK